MTDKMRSWHDFHIVGYAANGKRSELTFDLEWPYETDPSWPPARLRFSGVECYFLEHDLGGNIVYGFSDWPLHAFLEQWAARFEAENKWGWPRFWRPSPLPRQPVEEVLEAAFASLSAKGIQCTELSSSYGLSGWVLAVLVEELPIAPSPSIEPTA